MLLSVIKVLFELSAPKQNIESFGKPSAKKLLPLSLKVFIGAFFSDNNNYVKDIGTNSLNFVTF